MSKEVKLECVNDIRIMLAEEINSLRRGETTPVNVNAVVNASGKMLHSVKLEMEYMRMVNKTPSIPFMDPETT